MTTLVGIAYRLVGAPRPAPRLRVWPADLVAHATAPRRRALARVRELLEELLAAGDWQASEPIRRAVVELEDLVAGRSARGRRRGAPYPSRAPATERRVGRRERNAGG